MIGKNSYKFIWIPINSTEFIEFLWLPRLDGGRRRQACEWPSEGERTVQSEHLAGEETSSFLHGPFKHQWHHRALLMCELAASMIASSMSTCLCNCELRRAISHRILARRIGRPLGRPAFKKTRILHRGEEQWSDEGLTTRMEKTVRLRERSAALRGLH